MSPTAMKWLVLPIVLLLVGVSKADTLHKCTSPSGTVLYVNKTLQGHDCIDLSKIKSTKQQRAPATAPAMPYLPYCPMESSLGKLIRALKDADIGGSQFQDWLNDLKFADHEESNQCFRAFNTILDLHNENLRLQREIEQLRRERGRR